MFSEIRAKLFNASDWFGGEANGSTGANKVEQQYQAPRRTIVITSPSTYEEFNDPFNLLGDLGPKNVTDADLYKKK